MGVVQSVKRVLKPVARTPLGRAIRSRIEPGVRNVMGIDPPLFQEPRSWKHCISDAFVWRRDDGMQTRFDLMNLNSIMAPETAGDAHILMVFFDQHGQEIKREVFTLAAFATLPIFIDEVLSDRSDFGTFCVFHEHEKDQTTWPFETCMIERSYPGYKNEDTSDLWSYVHGCCNTIVLAYDFTQDQYYHMSRRAFRLQTFKPQLRFDDCREFEIMVSNPLTRSQEICVRACDFQRNTIESQSFELKPLACAIAKFDNAEAQKTVIEVDSHAFWCRPLIFKYYESHFDALHS